MNKNDLLRIRDIKQEDVPLIMATWLKGLYYGGDKFFRRIPKDLFMANYHQVLERILQSPGVVVKVACLKEDEDVVVGYSVYRQAGKQIAVDWVFVKRDWRGIKLARDLLPNDVIAITHLTRAGDAVAAKLYPKAVFNPFLN